MKIVVTGNGEKRYRFEDTDHLKQKQFEKATANEFDNKELAGLIMEFIATRGQLRAEAWRMILDAIRELDPELNGQLGYDYLKSEFRITGKDQ